MKKMFFITLLFLWGCTATQIPNYLQADNPFVKRFYVDYDEAMGATETALHDLGWEITQKMDPIVFEQSSSPGFNERQTLLVTAVRSTGFFVGTRYVKMNVFVRSVERTTDIEVRYLAVNSFFFKTIKTYNNESAAERIFSRIKQVINDKK